MEIGVMVSESLEQQGVLHQGLLVRGDHDPAAGKHTCYPLAGFLRTAGLDHQGDVRIQSDRLSAAMHWNVPRKGARNVRTSHRDRDNLETNSGPMADGIGSRP